MKLWRASRSAAPWFGPRSCWADTRDEAEVYLGDRIGGFGGDTLYVTEVDRDAALQLGPAPWTVVAEVIGVERDDYDPGDSDADLPAALTPVFSAFGYAWVVYRDHDLRGPGARTWLRCSPEPLAVSIHVSCEPGVSQEVR